MNNLPHINEYEELKEIKNSELTNRIAYECAIRNEKVIELRNDIKKLIGQVREKLIIAIATQPKKFDDAKLLKTNLSFNNEVFNIYNKGYFLPSFKKFIEEQEETKLIKEINITLLKEYWIREYYEEDIIEYIFSDNEFVYHVSETYNILTSNFTIGKKRTYITRFHQELGIIGNEDVLFPLPENIEDYNKPFNENINYDIYSISKSEKQINLDKLNLLVSTKRLIIPKELNPCVNVIINPYHIKDTEEHFEMILKTIKENESIVRISKEIDFFEKFSKIHDKYDDCLTKKAKKQITKEVIADAFFVYDFYELLKKRINKENEKIKQENKKIKQENKNDIKIKELREEINQLNKQPKDLYTKNHIKILEKQILEEEIPIKLLKKLHIKKVSEDYIFEKEEFLKYSKHKISSSTAYDYYYAIKTPIEQLKYKELLTGLKL
ncbi:hypothetical protein GCM10012288_22490 [Malaciobacter pacificus]|uniref:Uncharacterized protein n=1 Tax=Malaciobacter pacificus TaxID=1080223 RepID=A0A5C2H2L1_9BACT|nr:hypothetical protein [Malaciobacter pacificus]QEP33190.1 hypothetical protein APAC_0015 [Malaciobacter pacificus]GGD47751.1 hypothetical protein GCM10012288_22490 [Malaciobacter pacificus]